MQSRGITGRYARGEWNESKRPETIIGKAGFTRHETDVFDLETGVEDFYDAASAVSEDAAEFGHAIKKKTRGAITDAKDITMARIAKTGTSRSSPADVHGLPGPGLAGRRHADPYMMMLPEDPHMTPIGGSGAGGASAKADADRPRAGGRTMEEIMTKASRARAIRAASAHPSSASDDDLDTAANAMMSPPLVSEPLPVPRFQDLGLMTEGAAEANKRLYKALTSKKPERIFGVTSPWVNSYGKTDDFDTYFGAPEGDYQTDATKTGEWTDPYTGKVYEVFDNNFFAPDGDYRFRDSGKQRQFNGLMGGFGPGEARFKRTENPQDEILPDNLPRENPEDYWRLRGYELALQNDFLGPHRGEYAWTDTEGYSHVPTFNPANSMGLNELVRKYPIPDMNLHRNRMAYYRLGAGANTVENPDGVEAGITEPAALTVLAPTVPFNRYSEIGGEDVIVEGPQHLAESAELYASQTYRNYGEDPFQRTQGEDGTDEYGFGTVDYGGLINTWIPGHRTDFLMNIGRTHEDGQVDIGAGAPSYAALLRTIKAEAEIDRFKLGHAMGSRVALSSADGPDGIVVPSEFVGDKNVLTVLFEVWNAPQQRADFGEAMIGPNFRPDEFTFDRYTMRREDDHVYSHGRIMNLESAADEGELLDPAVARSDSHFERDRMTEGKHGTRALNRSSAPLAVAAGEDQSGTSRTGFMVIDETFLRDGSLKPRFFPSTFAKDLERGIEAGELYDAPLGGERAAAEMINRRVIKPFVQDYGLAMEFDGMGGAKRNVMGMDREITSRKSVIAR